MVQARSANVKIWVCVFIVKEIVLLVLIMNVFHLERVNLNLLILLKDVKKRKNVFINEFLLNKFRFE